MPEPGGAGGGAGAPPSGHLFGTLLLATYAYFIAAPSWNENSRFDLTRSMVERGRLNIDPYAHNTGDKATRNGHSYSDKAPGVSFLALPVYAAAFSYSRLAGAEAPASVLSDREQGDAALPVEDGKVLFNLAFRRSLYLCSLATSGLAGAILGAVFLTTAGGLGVAPRPALTSAIALAVGSLVLPYATMFFGHVVCAAMLFGAFALLVRGPTLSRAHLAIAGALAGAATATELPAAGAAALLGAYAWSRATRRRDILAFLGGIALPLALLGSYNAAAFGHPLRTGYAFVSRPEFAAGMSRGLLGVGLPDPVALGLLLFGRSRGLLYLSPVLVLAVPGFYLWFRDRPADRRKPALALAIVAFYLLFNSGFYMWTGGAALGPRHFIPALPFLCLAIPFVLRYRMALALGLALLALSVVNQTVATAVGANAPLVPDVLRDHVYLHFFRGEVPFVPGATNLGLLLGLPGGWSLLPLAGLWALGLRVLLPSREVSAA